MVIYQNSTHNWQNVGRLTQAPVLGLTPNNKPATSLSIALNVVNPNPQNDQDRTKTKYLNISVYGELATTICEKVKLGKGDMVQVALEFIPRTKVADGKNFNYIELVLDSFTLLTRAEANRQQNSQQAYQAPAQQAYQAPAQQAYQAPAQQAYQAPAQQAYQAPAQQAYQAPAQQAYQAPAQQAYQAPAQQAYQAPAQQAYQAPAQPAYQAPAHDPRNQPHIDFDDDIPF